MFILVTDSSSSYNGKILDVREECWKEIDEGNLIWMVYSVNGKIIGEDFEQKYWSWFYQDEFAKLSYIMADEKDLKLLVFL